MVWLGWPGADFNDVEKDIVANEAMKQGEGKRNDVAKQQGRR